MEHLINHLRPKLWADRRGTYCHPATCVGCCGLCVVGCVLCVESVFAISHESVLAATPRRSIETPTIAVLIATNAHLVTQATAITVMVLVPAQRERELIWDLGASHQRRPGS